MKILLLTAGLLAVAACAPAEPQPNPSASTPVDIVRLVEDARDLEGQCRGGPGDNPSTWAACEKRDAAFANLKKLGMCYGRPGEAAYQYRWHVCGD